MQLIVRHIATILKQKKKTALFYILVSALLCLILSYTHNPLSHAVDRLFYRIRFTTADTPPVSLVQIDNNFETPVTPGRIIAATGCALHNGAASVILLTGTITPGDYSDTGRTLQRLLAGESLALDSLLPSAPPFEAAGLTRILTEDDTIHLALLTHAANGKSRPAPAASPSPAAGIPDAGYSAAVSAPADMLIDNADCFIPSDTGRTVPLSATVGTDRYPHAALSALQDITGNTIAPSPHGITIGSSKSRIRIPQQNGKVRMHRHDTVFTDSNVHRYSFDTAASYYERLREKDALFTSLAEAAGHEVYPEIAAARRSFLYNSFPFVSKKHSTDFFEMYTEADTDASFMESGIIKEITTQLAENSFTDSKAREIRSKLDRIQSIDDTTDTLKNMNGSLCIISTIPSYATSGSHTPAQSCALFIDSILQHSTSAALPLPFAIALTLILCLYLYHLYTGSSPEKVKRSLMVFTTAALLLQILVFLFLQVYIDIIYVQGVCLTSFLAYTGEKPLRTLYIRCVALRTGINLPRNAIETIAASPVEYDFESTQSAWILECRLLNKEKLQKSLTAKTHISLLKHVYDIITGIVEQNGGVESQFDETHFRYCFLLMPGGSINPVLDAARSAQQIELKIQELNRNIGTAGDEAVLIHSALAHSTVTSLRQCRGEHCRIVYTGEETTLLQDLFEAGKAYEAGTVVTEEIYMHIMEYLPVRLLDKIRMHRRKSTETVYQILPFTDNETAALLLEQYNAARQLFYTKRFAESRKLFRAILKEFPGDGPSKLFAKRSMQHIKSNEPLRKTIDVRS